MSNSTQKFASVQEFLPIKEIRNSIVVLKNGNLRTVIMVKASGFELKSQTEQEAIINSFEQFINSLESPIQILMRSKKIDLDYYLKKLKKRADEEVNNLLASQINSYINFIRDLTENYNIMTKTFYIIVQHNISGVLEKKKISFWQNLFGSKSQPSVDINQIFEREKGALYEKTNIIIEKLSSIGLRAIQLNTQELIELFYSIYNPETSQQEKINETVFDATVPIINKKIQ